MPDQATGAWLRAGTTAPREPVDAFFVEHATGVTFDERSAAAFAGGAMPGNAFGACAYFGEGTDTPAPTLSKCTDGRAAYHKSTCVLGISKRKTNINPCWILNS